MTARSGFLKGSIKLLFDGASWNFTPSIGGAYPVALLAALPTLYRGDVVAMSSSTYAQRSTAALVDSRIPIVNMSVLIDSGGSQEIVNGLTAAQVLTAAEGYVDARKTAGVDKVIGITVPPSTVYTSPQNTVRATYNTSIKASSHFDAICDLDAIPELANPANTTYLYDGLHPTAAAVALIVAKFKATMAAIGLPT